MIYFSHNGIISTPKSGPADRSSQLNTVKLVKKGPDILRKEDGDHGTTLTLTTIRTVNSLVRHLSTVLIKH